jgi:TM2 domain-containing membrane protein YozV
MTSVPPPPPPYEPPPVAPVPGGDLVYPTTPPKDPVIVLILNLLLFGGVGYIIMGQKTKGIVAIILCFAIGIPTCGAGAGLVAIAGAIDGYLQAQQLKAGFPVGQWTFFNDHR